MNNYTLCLLFVLGMSLSSDAINSSESDAAKCILPKFPDHGYYRVQDDPNVGPGGEKDFVYLDYKCFPGYKLEGEKSHICYFGKWFPETQSDCKTACFLNPKKSVIYRCLMSYEKGMEGTRDCEDLEVEGTIVQPECRKPNFYSDVELPYMKCIDGSWTSHPKCNPECGTVSEKNMPLMIGGLEAQYGEVPWQAAVYSKSGITSMQICGGSLISATVLLSAAHCFWDELVNVQRPPTLYSIAVGKLHRDANHVNDTQYAQWSDVKKIILPHKFQGSDLYFQYDLAVVLVKKRFQFNPYVKPVCLDFSREFYLEQMQPGNMGKVAGWGLTTGYKGSESAKLKVMHVPFVSYSECLQQTRQTHPASVNFIVSDKICAGYGNGTTLCRGDSGGGLAFPAQINGVTRFFLRGIVSTSPTTLGMTLCNVDTLTSFTDVYEHKELIMRYWFN